MRFTQNWREAVNWKLHETRWSSATAVLLSWHLYLKFNVLTSYMKGLHDIFYHVHSNHNNIIEGEIATAAAAYSVRQWVLFPVSHWFCNSQSLRLLLNLIVLFWLSRCCVLLRAVPWQQSSSHATITASITVIAGTDIFDKLSGCPKRIDRFQGTIGACISIF